MYRADPDAVLVLEVYSKKTRKIPDEIVECCKKRLKQYDTAVKAAKESSLLTKTRIDEWIPRSEKRLRRRVGKSVMLLTFWK